MIDHGIMLLFVLYFSFSFFSIEAVRNEFSEDY